MRDGADVRLPPCKQTGRSVHTVPVVFTEMIRQICIDYSGIPDVRTLSMAEVLFFYDGLRPALKRHTEPREQASQTRPRKPAKRPRARTRK